MDARIKRLLICLMLPLGLIAVMPGCGKGIVGGEQTEVRFSYWGNYKDLDFWKRVVREFEEQHPEVRIKQEYTPGDYSQKLQLQLLGNVAADLILMDDESYPGYAARGYLEDLAPYIERDREEIGFDDFFDTAIESFTYNGLMAGMPWTGFPTVIFYNKELFDKAGVEYPSDEWTWMEFREKARALTIDYENDGRIDQFGTVFGYGFLEMEPVLWSFGTDILTDNNTRFAANNERGLEAVQFMYDLKYVDHSIAWTGEMAGVNKEIMLLTGRVGMVMGGWYMTRVLENIKGGMDWDIAHMPAGPYGHRHTRVSYDGISINANSTPEKKEIAWEFVKYLLTDEVQADIGIEGRSLPVRRSDAVEYFLKPDTELREEIGLEAMEYGKLTPVTTKYLELKNAIQRPFKKMEINELKPAEALAEAEKNTNEVLREEAEMFGQQE